LYFFSVRKALVAWIGKTDLRAPTESGSVGAGPVAQALAARAFDEVLLLADSPEHDVAAYLKWLRSRSKAPISVLHEKLTSPMHFGEIHQAAVRAVSQLVGGHPETVALTFHLSPGTPAMAAVWILLGKTRYRAELIESSKAHGVRTAEIPFDISADFLPDLLRDQDERLRLASAADPPAAPEFADIIHRSRVMARLIQRAKRIAIRNVPVLIEGESGTGKEMLARAIHQASPRKDKPFVAVNCGAIASELVESELFGHRRGAFTDAKTQHIGYFEAAHGGTLFLDEVGELPLASQVKLLRAVQEGEIVRVGTTRPVKVNVRIVAATNRTLTDEIASGRFREDLFYRLAVAVLLIPPLRERAEDLNVLFEALLDQVNRESSGEPGFKEKRLSVSAKNLLLAHSWPGNVRELLNTLRRAAIWNDADTISSEDAREALLPALRTVGPHTTGQVLDRPLGNGLDLPAILQQVARHYLQRAMIEANSNKTKAAELLGLASYQTLTNWLTKYGVE
jgi:DNA-binding NtrC family response regulator